MNTEEVYIYIRTCGYHNIKCSSIHSFLQITIVVVVRKKCLQQIKQKKNKIEHNTTQHNTKQYILSTVMSDSEKEFTVEDTNVSDTELSKEERLEAARKNLKN